MSLWHHLCAQALQPSAVSDEPLIHTGRGVPNAGNTDYVEAAADSCGDVAAHGFCRRGTTAIFDVRITDTDAPSHRGQVRKGTRKRKRQSTWQLAWPGADPTFLSFSKWMVCGVWRQQQQAST